MSDVDAGMGGLQGMRDPLGVSGPGRWRYASLSGLVHTSGTRSELVGLVTLSLKTCYYSMPRFLPGCIDARPNLARLVRAKRCLVSAALATSIVSSRLLVATTFERTWRGYFTLHTRDV